MKQTKRINITSLIGLIGSASMAFSSTHTVQTGDTLWRISAQHKVSVASLQQANNLSGNTIQLGQVLTIPAEVATASPAIHLETETKSELKPLDSSSKKISKSEIEKEPTKKLLYKAPLVSEQIVKETEKSLVKQLTKPKGMAALSSKQRAIVKEQIILDRKKMGPGIIDGYTGSFSKTAIALAMTYRPESEDEELVFIVETKIPAAILHYINPTLPGSGKRPDFKKATEEQSLMMYKSAVELLAERYHCSENLLIKMNPQLDFKNLTVGQGMMVPNVTEFKIEHFMNSAGQPVANSYLRKGKKASRVDVDYRKNRLMVWGSGVGSSEAELLATFPVTTNIEKGPKYQRTISFFAPAPTYMRKKTGLKLKAGPNSPVGIVWAKLGDGFGIHGTSDGSGNGYNTSSGCIRLSNWDMAVFVQMVPSKTKVNFISEESLSLDAQASR